MSDILDQVQEEVKPDMTPMIDCVFLMIIFFICIDFRVLESKVTAYLPKDKGSQSDVVEPQEQLSVKVFVDQPGTPEYPSGVQAGAVDPATHRPVRFKLQGHTVRWEVGPKPLHSLADVERELERIAKDPASQVPDKETGGKKLMACIVEAYPGTYYDDVSKTADACHAAGFKEINFGGGLGAK